MWKMKILKSFPTQTNTLKMFFILNSWFYIILMRLFSLFFLGEFQRGGFFVTHVLECPLEASPSGQPSCDSLLLQRVTPVLARIRRSLKPKRVVLISELLAPLISRFSSAKLGCPVILDSGKPFNLNPSDLSLGAQHLREALAAAAAEM